MLSSLPSAAADKARDLARDLTRDLARDLIVKQVTSQIVDVPTVRKHKLSPRPCHGAELRHRAGSPRQRRRGDRRGGDARRPALERGERRGHEGQYRRLPRSRRDRACARPLRDGRRPHGCRPPSATTPPRPRSRPPCSTRWARRSACPFPLCSGARCATAFPCSGRSPPATVGQEIEEAERKLAARLHRTFKVKIGAQVARGRHGAPAPVWPAPWATAPS